jgi:multidrug resistance efflux pump
MIRIAHGLAFLTAIGWLVGSTIHSAQATPLKLAGGVNVPSQHDGIIIKILVAEGDKVEAGKLLAQLDDRLAVLDRDIKQARANAARAEFELAVKSRDEAKKRYDTAIELRRRTAIGEEDLRAALLTMERYVADAVAKKEAIQVADLELKQAEIILEMYQIRSPTGGVVKFILKQRGEAVKNLETAFQIQRSDK